MDNRVYKYYLGEIFLGGKYYDVLHNAWKIVPNKDSAVRELLAGNKYVSRQDAENAIKAQVSEECHPFIKRVVSDE